MNPILDRVSLIFGQKPPRWISATYSGVWYLLMGWALFGLFAYRPYTALGSWLGEHGFPEPLPEPKVMMLIMILMGFAQMAHRMAVIRRETLMKP